MDTLQASRQEVSISSHWGRFMRQHPLFFFFLIAYGISWIMVLPFILSEWGILSGNFTLAFILKSFGPFLAAYLMLRVTEGKEGVLRLRRSIRQARAGWGWYLLVLLGIPALILLGIILQPGTLASFQSLKPALLVSYLINYVLVFFGGGPLGEEPGWRGFALPRMQSRYGPLWGTLLLGLLWTCWHLPDFLTSAQGGGPGSGFDTFVKNFSFFLLMVTALAVIFTWIFNNTRGSVFLAILAHASVNTPQLVLVPLFPTVDVTKLNLAALIAFGGLALLVLILTRGRLGYQQGQEGHSALRATEG